MIVFVQTIRLDLVRFFAQICSDILLRYFAQIVGAFSGSERRPRRVSGRPPAVTVTQSGCRPLEVVGHRGWLPAAHSGQRSCVEISEKSLASVEMSVKVGDMEHTTALTDFFVTASRDNGTDYTKLTDDAPEWLRDAVQAAHGDEMPNDWRYRMCAAIVEALTDDYDDGPSDPDAWHEIADGLVECYNSDRIAWLADDMHRAECVDEAVSELGHSDQGTFGDIGIGQYHVLYDMVSTLATAIAENLDDDDDDDDEPINPFTPDTVPESMGYNVFAVMADGGTLCYRCVIDPTNPITDRRGDHVRSPDGWEVVAFDIDGNVDGPLSCDHCNAVIVEDLPGCPACGQPIDYCQGHGEIGDPDGAAILAAHDDGDHSDCHSDGCDS